MVVRAEQTATISTAQLLQLQTWFSPAFHRSLALIATALNQPSPMTLLSINIDLLVAEHH
jgi:hypothetical protein